MGVVDAFENCCKNYQECTESIEPLIAEIGEFPGKIQEAADGCKDNIDAMEDMMEKAKASAAVAKAVKDAKNCC